MLAFPPLLQAELPFSAKPKQQKARKRPSYLSARSVILEKDERRAYTLLQEVATMRNVKDAKAAATAATSKAAHEKKKTAEAARWAAAGKDAKKRKHALQGVKDTRKARQAAGVDTG